MVCKNCGAMIDDNISFCTQCGVKLDKSGAGFSVNSEKPEETPVYKEFSAPEEAEKPEETAEKPEAADSAPEPEAPEAPIPETPGIPRPAEQQNTAAASYYEPMMQHNNAYAPPAPKEKPFFGVGALVFCLVLIGILSITTGAFAGLYFSTLV